MARVLVVEDDPAIGNLVALYLRRDGHEIELVDRGPTALAQFEAAADAIDLIVLDLMLPGLDGRGLCRRIRQASDVPIIMLTALDDDRDKIEGLELGADDYLTKPFALRELLARVRAMLRRAQMVTGAEGAESAPNGVGSDVRAATGNGQGPLVIGNLAVDPARRLASLGGAALTLKPKEFDLLYYLARHPGIVVSRDALLREVWGYDFPIDTRTVDVHIRGLRAKVETDPSQPLRIETVRGFGYRFEPDPA